MSCSADYLYMRDLLRNEMKDLLVSFRELYYPISLLSIMTLNNTICMRNDQCSNRFIKKPLAM